MVEASQIVEDYTWESRIGSIAPSGPHKSADVGRMKCVIILEDFDGDQRILMETICALAGPHSPRF